MDKFMCDYKNRIWKHDINSYYNWKALRDGCENIFLKKACQESMDRIKSYYPQHAALFED